jgi:hypothetical protein
VEALSLPDPKPRYVPNGFEPFPDRPLRGVRQPLMTEAARRSIRWFTETEVLMRQYYARLVNGSRPGESSEAVGDFLKTVPRICVQLWASDSRPDFMATLRDTESMVIAGFPAAYSRTERHQSIYCGSQPMDPRNPRAVKRRSRRPGAHGGHRCPPPGSLT